MENELLEIGTRIQFSQDHLSGTGVICRVGPDDDVYTYYVRVESCGAADAIDLHNCWGFFDEDVGWGVTTSGVVAVLGYDDEPPMTDIDGSLLDAILAM